MGKNREREEKISEIPGKERQGVGRGRGGGDNGRERGRRRVSQKRARVRERGSGPHTPFFLWLGWVGFGCSRFFPLVVPVRAAAAVARARRRVVGTVKIE